MPRRGLETATAGTPAPRSSCSTPAHPELSAKAPWTRATVGAGAAVMFAWVMRSPCLGRGGAAPRPAAGSPTAARNAPAVVGAGCDARKRIVRIAPGTPTGPDATARRGSSTCSLRTTKMRASRCGPTARRDGAGRRTGDRRGGLRGVGAPSLTTGGGRMAGTGSWPGLVGRRAECDRLSGAVAAAKAGRSQVLVLRGEAGIGKTALLEFLLGRATGCQVARAAGVESEMELPFAGLHQLCAPHLHRLDALPSPQREALGTAFGLRPGTAPDRFLVGLAVLTLLSEVAEERPLVCAVDDVQWLDIASVQTLEFVARRLVAEPVALVFAVRDTGDGTRLQGLPQLVVGRLGNADAAALLRAAFPAALDPRVRARILAESSRNPLALLELPRELSAAELAFGAASSAVGTPLMHRLEQQSVRQVAPLSDASRRMLLIAAAEPMGDVLLVRRASRHLGIGPDAARAAEAADLIVLADRVRVRHPLVRSAVYRSSSPGDRRWVHAALADVTDPELDPDRRAWHRARATVGPDEDVATELERSADRALSHGGLAAAAAFLEQAAALTPDPGRRVRRSLDAARASVHAGAFGDAATLLATAEEEPLDEAERALIDLLRAEVSFAVDQGN